MEFFTPVPFTKDELLALDALAGEESISLYVKKVVLAHIAAQQSVERTVLQEEPLRDDEFSSWDDDPGYW